MNSQLTIGSRSIVPTWEQVLDLCRSSLMDEVNRAFDESPDDSAAAAAKRWHRVKRGLDRAKESLSVYVELGLRFCWRAADEREMVHAACDDCVLEMTLNAAAEYVAVFELAKRSGL